MRKVTRAELTDYQTYNDTRDETRSRVMEVKRPRRVHVGEYLTFLFENTDTVRYQVQEMMRTERIVREADIQHELDTYNDLLGDDGQLGCCLLIEIDDPAQRDVQLRAWRDLPGHVYIRCADGTRAPATFDRAQVGDEKLSSVQYLKFSLGTGGPAAIGCDLPALSAEVLLTDEQRAALEHDLGRGLRAS